MSGLDKIDKNIPILVVDDQATMRSMLKSALWDLGFSNIIEADDGESAVTRLKENDIKLIISDWKMRKMSGLTLLKKIKASRHYQRVPFLMLTAQNEAKEVIMAIKEGVSNYLVKPVNVETLREKLEETLCK